MDMSIIVLVRKQAHKEGASKVFTLETTEIAKAIERAKELHPAIKIKRFGEYLVSGSKGATYIVRCWRDREGKHVDCTCQTRDGVACKHGMAAVSLHVGWARQRQTFA